MKERELPEGWEWKRLGDICKTTSGGTPARNNETYFNGNIPWLKSGELENNIIYSTEETISQEGLENSSTKIIPKGTPLIALYGATVGKVGILGIDSAINQAICAVFPSNKIDPKFLFHFLIKSRPSLLNLRAGGAQPNISQDIVRNIQIPLPPLPIQHQIVAVLKQAEAVKRQRQEADALTGALLQSVFLDMFGDLLRNDRGWVIEKFGNISKINMGQSPPGESYNKERRGIPLLNGPEEFGSKYPTPKQYTEKPSKICDIGDILFCVRGATAGRMNWSDKNYCIGRGLAAIQSVPGKTEIRFLYQFLLMNYEKFQKTGRGSTFINISRADITNLKIPLPPLALQQQFARVVQDVERIRERQAESKREIYSLFDGLMAGAFAGDLVA